MKVDPLNLESQNQAKNITVVLPNQQEVFDGTNKQRLHIYIHSNSSAYSRVIQFKHSITLENCPEDKFIKN